MYVLLRNYVLYFISLRANKLALVLASLALSSCSLSESMDKDDDYSNAIFDIISKYEAGNSFRLCESVANKPKFYQEIVLDRTSIMQGQEFSEENPDALNAAFLAIQIAMDKQECDNISDSAESLFKLTYKRNFDTLQETWPLPTSEEVNILKVQQTVRDLALEDQAARNSWLELNGTSGDEERLKWATAIAAMNVYKTDSKSIEYVSEILDTVGWPTKAKFGEYTSFFMWLLVQHADAEPEVQLKALNLLRPLLSTKEVSKSDFAYLEDRVAVNYGKAQIYGTQSTGKCVDGVPEMEKIQNIATLNSRRKEMELNEHSIYLKSLSKSICAN